VVKLALSSHAREMRVLVLAASTVFELLDDGDEVAEANGFVRWSAALSLIALATSPIELSAVTRSTCIRLEIPPNTAKQRQAIDVRWRRERRRTPSTPTPRSAESVRARSNSPPLSSANVSATAATGVLGGADVGPRDTALSRLMAFHGPGSTTPSRA
jgi:hypothetical protein